MDEGESFEHTGQRNTQPLSLYSTLPYFCTVFPKSSAAIMQQDTRHVQSKAIRPRSLIRHFIFRRRLSVHLYEELLFFAHARNSIHNTYFSLLEMIIISCTKQLYTKGKECTTSEKSFICFASGLINLI